MLYRIKRRKSGCRAPPWGTYRDFSTLQWKTADFSCRYHRFNRGSMAAPHRKKGSCPPDYQWRQQRRYSCSPWGYYAILGKVPETTIAIRRINVDVFWYIMVVNCKKRIEKDKK